MTTNTTERLTGRAAIEHAEATGLPLHSYTSPTEEGRDDLTPAEAREIAAEDPALVWIDVSACAYCSANVPAAGTVPAVSDNEAWEAEARRHEASCEWVATRAHRIDA